MALVRYIYPTILRKLIRAKLECVESSWKQQIHWFPLCTAASKETVNSCMPLYTDDPFIVGVSEVIDVRAPNEFKEDRIPGAINLPVLTEAQRGVVGLRYSQSSFDGRKLGAQIISQNISNHLENHFRSKPSNYSPLIYCWRGGQRSYSLGLVLAQIGFQVRVLKGGYKLYRKLVRTHLQQLPTRYNFKVISGLTGCGKTKLLKKLQLSGEQVLDLEALAKHKGSILGPYPGEEQPSQKLWESCLRNELSSFDPQRPVWVESESQRIGMCHIPDVLFRQMQQGKRFRLDVPLAGRVGYILEDYRYWMTDVDETKKIVSTLEKYLGRKRIQVWFHLMDEKRWEEFVEDILIEHYDKMYKKSQDKYYQIHSGSTPVEVISLVDLSDDIVTETAQSLTKHSLPIEGNLIF